METLNHGILRFNDECTLKIDFDQETDDMTVTRINDATGEETVISGGGQGGGDIVFEMHEATGSKNKWDIPQLQNTFLSGGYLEVVFSDPSPATDYGDIIDWGSYEYLSQYSNDWDGHLYHMTSGDTPAFVVRQNSTDYIYAYDTSLSQHVLRVDKDNVYIDGEIVVPSFSNLTAFTIFGLGSTQGSKRFQGTYHSIIYK